MPSLGYDNVIVEVIHGGTPRHYTQVIREYVKAHTDSLIDDGSGMSILPPAFNLVVIDNLTSTTWTKDQTDDQMINPASAWHQYSARNYVRR